MAPNSAKECYRKFGITLYSLRKLLIKYNLKEHTKEIYTKAGQQYAIKTNLQKYGVESSNQADIVKEKMKATIRKHFGVDSPAKNEKIKQKIKTTKFIKYGNENYNNIEKNKQTCLEKYGYKHVFQADEIKLKIQNTYIEKYGVTHSSQIPHIQKKRAAKYTYNNELFDSFPELCVYMYFYSTGATIIRSPVKLKYISNNKVHYYIPDFSINGKLVEIKGPQFKSKTGKWCCPYDHTKDKNAEAKYDCAIKNSVAIWYKEDYTKYIDWFAKTYSKADFKIKK